MKSYRLEFSLPPTPNQSYRVGPGPDGHAKMYMTATARKWKNEAALIAWGEGLRPQLTDTFAVAVWLFMEHWGRMDVDAIKLLVDAVIGERIDHRVVSLMVHKVVGSGPEGCVVRVRVW